MASIIITVQDARSDDDLTEDDVVKVTIEADPPLDLTSEGGSTGAQRAAVRMLNSLNTAFREITSIHVEDDTGHTITVDAQHMAACADNPKDN